MRKLATILLTGILLFHWMGYQALYSYWMQQADDNLEARLDMAEYDNQELITIAMPLHLPYLINQAAFERFDGEITFDGIAYKYVQRRVYHDSLFVQCLPNQEAMRLNTARNDCFTFTTDIQQSHSGFSKPGFVFAKYFTGGDNLPVFRQPVVLSDSVQNFVATNQAIPVSLAASGPDQPPETIS